MTSETHRSMLRHLITHDVLCQKARPLHQTPTQDVMDLPQPCSGVHGQKSPYSKQLDKSPKPRRWVWAALPGGPGLGNSQAGDVCWRLEGNITSDRHGDISSNTWPGNPSPDSAEKKLHEMDPIRSLGKPPGRYILLANVERSGQISTFPGDASLLFLSRPSTGYRDHLTTDH